MSARRLFVTATALLFAGCNTTLTEQRTLGLSPAGDFVGRVESVMERRYAGVIRQQYDFSCGSAALATLLRHHYGQRVGEADVFKGMWASGDRAQIRKLGFSLLDMKRYLAAQNLEANGFTVSLDQVAKGGTPGIALINLDGYKHFVVVKGVTGTEVLIGDPSTGLQVVPAEKFKAIWNGVFFIINPTRHQGVFNAATHWAGYTRAPVGGTFSQPVSQQALALTAPFYRDF